MCECVSVLSGEYLDVVEWDDGADVRVVNDDVGIDYWLVSQAASETWKQAAAATRTN